jgi:glutaredoxin 2
VLERLWAAAKSAYRDIAAALPAYKEEVRQRFGLTLEALASDRYAGFGQLSHLMRLRDLAKYLAERGFYVGQISIADLVIAADLFPLQLLDGVRLPIDLLYYFERVEDTCRTGLGEGLVSTLH